MSFLSSIGMGANAPTNAFAAAAGDTSLTGQLLFSGVLVAVLYVSFVFLEAIYTYVHRMTMNRTPLLPDTYSMDDKSTVISQDPNDPRAISVALSNNERTGIEFTYSFFLNVNPSSFRQEHGLLHLFHKGYSSQFPLLAPGVYLRADTNTLRVYMNTYKTWNNFVEVQNLPIGKWVHVVIVCKDHALEIYVNGNLAKKMSFDGFAPYQNYQDIVCFSQRRISLRQSQTPSVDANGFDVFGAAKGLMSRLNYFSYALCYAEIQQMYNEGPSSKMDSSLVANLPPYLADSWWGDKQ
jgi:hypothetical protein